MTAGDPFMVREAACRASVLVATGRFRPDDWEDLQQELILDLLRRSRRFDPARGDWQGFVRGVARNQASVLVMRERRRAPEILADDLLANREDCGDGEPLDVLEKHPAARVGDEIQQSLDVRRVIEDLPDGLQVLVGLIGETLPVRDICRRLGKSRSRVYQMTLELRAAFVRAGLRPKRTRQSGAQR